MQQYLLQAVYVSCKTLLRVNEIYPLNETHKERLVFHTVQYWNGWLAASDLFHMFTQSIKFYTFHYQYRCLKNVIHQIDSKNGWLLLSASLRQNLVFLRGFIFKPTEKAQVLLKNGTNDFQNSPPFERSVCFYVTISGKFEHFQYFNLETDFLENENFF